MSSTVWPNMQYPEPTPMSQNWTPASPSPNTSTKVDQNTTTDAIRSEFSIDPPVTIAPSDYPPVP